MLTLLKLRLKLIPREQLKAGNILLITLPPNASRELQVNIGTTAQQVFKHTNVRVVLAPSNVSIKVIEVEND